MVVKIFDDRQWTHIVLNLFDSEIFNLEQCDCFFFFFDQCGQNMIHSLLTIIDDTFQCSIYCGSSPELSYTSCCSEFTFMFQKLFIHSQYLV